MTYSIFVFFTLVLLFLYYKSGYKQDKFINTIFFLMWILFSIEYYTTKDYIVYYEGFYGFRDGEHWEPLYRLLITLFRPLGFIVFNSCVSAFEIFTLWFITKKIVPAKYIWIALLLLILNTNNLMLYMNLKRQFFAMMTSIWIVYFLLYSKNKFRYVWAIISFLCAINIHSSAFITVIYFVLPFIKFRFNWIGIVLFAALFIGSFAFSISSISEQLATIMLSILNDSEFYARYLLKELENEGADGRNGFFYQLYHISLFILLLCFGKKFDDNQYRLLLLSLLSITMMNLFNAEFFRLFLYFSFFNIINTATLLKITYDQRRTILYFYMLFLSLANPTKSYLNAFVFDKVTYMTVKYKHFYTIFHRHPDKTDYYF